MTRKSKYVLWSPQEVEILEEMAESHSPEQIARRLNKHGYKRTREGICKKLRSLGYSVRPTLDNYSCKYIAEVLQMDSSTVADWVMCNSQLVESMGGIIRRTSLFNLGVQVSQHPAFDILSFRFCRYGYNRDSFRGRQEDF